MRVCVVAYTFYELDGRVRRYTETLAMRGDQIDVIALRRERQSSHDTFDRINIYRIQKRVIDEKTKISYLLKLARFFLKSTIFITYNHLRKHYDLIHIHTVPDFQVFAAWLPKLMGSKIILDIHDILPEFYSSKFNVRKDSFSFRALVFLERLSTAFAHHVIISNHLWEKTLIGRSVKKEKCSVVLNYPEQSIFYRRPQKRKNEKFIMMYPGTLNWHQGLDVAIRAFFLIKERAPEAEFQIYGRGSQKRFLEELIKELGLQERVFIKGILPTVQIAEIMTNADVGIVPKRNDSFGGEAFSTKILEFMSLGIPVIVSATSIDRYYFNESIVKYFRPGDEKDLAESMLLLIRESKERERLAENASKFVAEYAWDKKKHEYLNLVDRLASSKKKIF